MQLHQSIDIQCVKEQECLEIEVGAQPVLLRKGLNYKKQEILEEQQIVLEVDGNRIKITNISMFQESRSVAFRFEDCICDNVQIIQNVKDYLLGLLLRNGTLYVLQFDFQEPNEYQYKQIQLEEGMDIQNVEYIVNYQDGQSQIILVINNQNIIEVYQCQMNVDPADKEVQKLFQIDVINYHFYQQIIRKVVNDNQTRILKIRLFHNLMVFVLTSDGILRLINLYSRKIVQSVQLNGFNSENIGNNEFDVQYDSINNNNGNFKILVSVQRLNLENQYLHLLELEIRLKITDLEICSLQQINQNIEPMISWTKFRAVMNKKIKQIVKQLVVKQQHIFVLVQQIDQKQQQVIQISIEYPILEHIVCKGNEILSIQKLNSSMFVVTDRKVAMLISSNQLYSRIVLSDFEGIEQKLKQVYMLSQDLYDRLEVQSHQIDCYSIQKQMENHLFKVDSVQCNSKLKNLEIGQQLIEFINMIYEADDSNMLEENRNSISAELKIQQSNHKDEMSVFNRLISNQIKQQLQNKIRFVQKVQTLLCYIKIHRIKVSEVEIERMMMSLNYKQVELNSMIQKDVLYDFIRHSISNYDYMYNEDILNYQNIEKYAEEQLQNYKVTIDINDLIQNCLHVDPLIITLFSNQCFSSLSLLFQQMKEYLDYSVNILYMNLITEVKMEVQNGQSIIECVDKMVARLATSDTLISQSLFSNQFKQFIDRNDIIYTDSNSTKVYYLFLIGQIESNQCDDNLKVQSELAMKASLLQPYNCLQQQLYQYVISENLQRCDYRNTLNLINNLKDEKVEQFYQQLVDTVVRNEHVSRLGQLKINSRNYQSIIDTLKEKQAFQLNEMQKFISKKNEVKADRIVLLNSNRNYSRILNYIYYMNGEYENSVRTMYNYMQTLLEYYQKTDSSDIRNKLITMILVAIQKVQVSMDLSKQDQVYNYCQDWIDKKQLLKLKTVFTNIKYLEEIRNVKIGVQEIIYSRDNQQQVVKEIVKQFACLGQLDKSNQIVLQFDELLCQEYFAYLLDKYIENKENQKDVYYLHLELVQKLIEGLNSERIMASQIIEIMFLKHQQVNVSIQLLDQLFQRCPDHVVSLGIQFGKLEEIRYLLKKYSRNQECPIHVSLANQVLISQ